MTHRNKPVPARNVRRSICCAPAMQACSSAVQTSKPQLRPRIAVKAVLDDQLGGFAGRSWFSVEFAKTDQSKGPDPRRSSSFSFSFAREVQHRTNGIDGASREMRTPRVENEAALTQRLNVEAVVRDEDERAALREQLIDELDAPPLESMIADSERFVDQEDVRSRLCGQAESKACSHAAAVRAHRRIEGIADLSERFHVRHIMSQSTASKPRNFPAMMQFSRAVRKGSSPPPSSMIVST